MSEQTKEKILANIKNQISSDDYSQIQKLLGEHLVAKPREHLGRIPFLLPLLATFGFVSTLYGMEKLLDQTNLIHQPLLLIAIGVVILLLTGTFVQKL